jgi:hypothetical protein
VTVYEHDHAGRVVASQPESEWDPEQQEMMLALLAYENSLCPLCGRPLSVCSDPANEGRWKVGPPTRCHASTAVSVARADYDKAPNAGALLFGAELS